MIDLMSDSSQLTFSRKKIKSKKSLLIWSETLGNGVLRVNALHAQFYINIFTVRTIAYNLLDKSLKTFIGLLFSTSRSKRLP